MTLEAFLARLYTDEKACAEFLANPRGAAGRAGFTGEDLERICAVDRAALELAARSFARKRAHVRR